MSGGTRGSVVGQVMDWRDCPEIHMTDAAKFPFRTVHVVLAQLTQNAPQLGSVSNWKHVPVHLENYYEHPENASHSSQMKGKGLFSFNSCCLPRWAFFPFESILHLRFSTTPYQPSSALLVRLSPVSFILVSLPTPYL
jgi:hypothetical protein